MQYVENRDYLHFLANHINIESSRRTVYFDFGTSTFESSVLWFWEKYPHPIDKIYAFEVVPDRFQIPAQYNESIGVRIEFFNCFVGTENKETPRTIDASQFILDHVKQDDFVIVKMDIENAEWLVLDKLEKTGALSLIDELFVELHFQFSPLTVCSIYFIYFVLELKKKQSAGWDAFRGHTIDDARNLLSRYRQMGVYAHYWP